jgi:autotransporter-associated beta strand protein
MAGASLTLAGGSLGAGAVEGGAGGSDNSGFGVSAPGQGGAAYGSGIFLQGNQTVTLTPAAGDTEVISGVIADMTGSKDQSGQTGAGTLLVDGAGVAELAATNTFTGGVTLKSGVLELAAAGAQGSGAVTFAGVAGSVATLRIDAAAEPASGGTFGSTLVGFGNNQALDLTGLRYAAGASAIVSGSTLSVTSDGTTLNFTLAAPTNTHLLAMNDGAGGVEVVSAPPLTIPGAGTVLAGVGTSVPGVNLITSVPTSTVTLSDVTGTLAVAAGGATVSGSGTNALSIGGSISAIDAALATLTYTPGAGATSDTITLDSTDASGAAYVQSMPIAVIAKPYAWAKGVSADWGTSGAWTGGVAGGFPEDWGPPATIAASGTYTVGVAAGESYAAGALSLASAKATLSVAGSLTITSGLTVAKGVVSLAGGTLNAGVSLAVGTKLTGFGTVTGPISDLGAITVAGGALDLAGALTGGATDVVTIDKGATLTLGAAASGLKDITFVNGAPATLRLLDPAAFTAKVALFGAGDVIEVDGPSMVTAVSRSGSVLDLYAGMTQVGAINLIGSYTTLAFSLTADGQGGVNITVAKPTAPVFTVPGAQTATAGTPVAIAGISLADADAQATSAVLTVTATAADGSVSVTAGQGTVTGSSSAKVTLKGSLAQVNADLATLSFDGLKAGAGSITLAASDSNGGKSLTAKIAVTVGAASGAVLFSQTMAAFSEGEAAHPAMTLAPQASSASLTLAMPAQIR